MKRPSFQFYPGDWLGDTNLSMCSLGAQGLWIRLMCHMHQGEPYGYLRVKGRVIPPDKLYQLVGKTPDEVSGLWQELIDWEVPGLDESGCIYSRRMVRDEEKRQEAARQGAKGGNPNLKRKANKEEGLSAGLTTPLTPGINSSSSSTSLKTTEKEEEEARSPESPPADTGDWERFKVWLKTDRPPAWSDFLLEHRWLTYFNRFGQTIIKLAAQEAASQGAGEKPAYTFSILDDWITKRVQSPEDAQEALRQFKVAGKRPMGDGGNRPRASPDGQKKGLAAVAALYQQSEGGQS